MDAGSQARYLDASAHLEAPFFHIIPFPTLFFPLWVLFLHLPSQDCIPTCHHQDAAQNKSIKSSKITQKPQEKTSVCVWGSQLILQDALPARVVATATPVRPAAMKSHLGKAWRRWSKKRKLPEGFFFLLIKLFSFLLLLPHLLLELLNFLLLCLK